MEAVVQPGSRSRGRVDHPACFVSLVTRQPPVAKLRPPPPPPPSPPATPPGPPVLPVAESPRLGRLGGAICFDMDFPGFLRQAGAAGVDLLLQPSNTWGPIGEYHFRNNALRAVEGGFTYLRCSAGGYSGVADPLFTFVHHQASLNRDVLAFSVPLQGHVWTPYAHGAGALLEGLNAAAAALLCVAVLLPTGWWDRARRRRPGAAGPGGDDRIEGPTEQDNGRQEHHQPLLQQV